jgi:hypothetical protein
MQTVSKLSERNIYPLHNTLAPLNRSRHHFVSAWTSLRSSKKIVSHVQVPRDDDPCDDRHDALAAFFHSRHNTAFASCSLIAIYQFPRHLSSARIRLVGDTMPYTFNGCGTRFYGHQDRADDGSYVTTEWIGTRQKDRRCQDRSP